MQVTAHAATFVVAFADQVPEAKDVKAGWLAFGIFIALILAVVLLGRSLVKQLRKADAAEEAGLYDPSDKPKFKTTLPVESAEPAGPGDRQPPSGSSTA